MIDWYVKARSFGNCNCDHACPCQFEGLPNHGFCQAFGVFTVDEGMFGAVDLAGVTAALVYAWPGPVFEGGGELQLVIDDRASVEQQEAISKITLGGETVEASTHWWVFATMCDTHHETLVRRIDFDLDMEQLTARCHIDGVLESSAEPIRSPLDGSPHRVRIQVPHGIEFDTAEIVNGRTNTQGPVKLDLNDTYGQICELHLTHRGPAHNLQAV
jgi:hypothetical protein